MRDFSLPGWGTTYCLILWLVSLVLRSKVRFYSYALHDIIKHFLNVVLAVVDYYLRRGVLGDLGWG